MARKGEKFVTFTELENQLRSTNNRINSILDFVTILGGTRNKNFFIQCGYRAFVAGGSAVTFTFPFKTGTNPYVVFGPCSNAVVVMTSQPSATGFTGYGKQISDGTGTTCNACWVAIGERG